MRGRYADGVGNLPERLFDRLMVFAPKTILRFLFCCVQVIALGACMAETGSKREGGAVLGALAAPPPGHARIFFYRTENPFMFALEPKFIVNGKAVGHAVHGEAFFRDAKPGPYRIAISSDPDTLLRILAEDGETIFIKVTVDFNLTGSRLTVTRVNGETGRDEVRKRTLRDRE
jgi:hypothetical protein